MTSLQIFPGPLPSARSSVICLLPLSISRPMLILPDERCLSPSVSPPCCPPPPLLRPLRHRPSGSHHPDPQWLHGGSWSQQVRLGSIHNDHIAVIEQAARIAKPRAVPINVYRFFSLMDSMRLSSCYFPINENMTGLHLCFQIPAVCIYF